MPDAGIGVSLLLAALIFLGIVVVRWSFCAPSPRGFAGRTSPRGAALAAVW